MVRKDHNRVLAKIHLDELALPMGITDYEIKKVLPTQAQFAKCYADAEAKCAASMIVKAADPLSRKTKQGGTNERHD